MEIFAQEFEPASYFCDWTWVDLGAKYLVIVSSRSLKMREFSFAQFDNFIFWSSLFSEIGPYFCQLMIKWTQVQSQN